MDGFNMYKQKGFSLAEALITLLIVSLLTLASVPIITKKHKTKNSAKVAESQSHGTYACYLDGSGKYHFYSKIEGAEETEGIVDTSYCEFSPPADGRNFYITAIGGGGGGGAGYQFDEDKSFFASGSYQAPEAGTYYALVIGAGGGALPDDGYSGGSGGYNTGVLDLEKGEDIIVMVGKGAMPTSDTAKSPTKGGDSQIISKKRLL